MEVPYNLEYAVMFLYNSTTHQENLQTFFNLIVANNEVTVLG